MTSFTRQEKSWIAYHVAKSAFALTVSAVIMPIFFKDFASRGIDSTISTANWAFGLSAASLCVALLSPILGSIADHKNVKKGFLAFFLFEGILFTGALVFVQEGAWFICLVIYILAKIGFSGADMFYNALLVDVTSKKRMDRVSANGFGWGYIGGVIPFVICMGIIFIGEGNQGTWESIPVLPAKISFAVAALWWFVFSLPLLFNVKQKASGAPGEKFALLSLNNLSYSFKRLAAHKNILIFLVAYFFYINGVHTTIGMATAYGMEIGLDIDMLILAILMIQIVGFPFALLAGRLTIIFSTKTILYIGITIYSIITILSFALPSVTDHAIKTIIFWLIAFLIGMSQGGIQALSRSYFGRLIPEQNTAWFYSLYNLFRKFATIIGPLVMGIVATSSGHSRWGVLSMLLFFVVGATLLTRVELVSSGKPGVKM
uniref:MFS transporter, UMF1 family n=1 Tax=Candidatus Kentrum sp. FW TaxID=2126338 RepID=A0A450U4F2_9GAMM|nr:MAG: MFS transporter, UMF1 family [Candidatus Kentron sp. FW]